MKVIKYQLMKEVNHGTEEQPDIHQIFSDVSMGWNEANEELAKREAYNGVYTIVDDGEPVQEPEPTAEERITELETENHLLNQQILALSDQNDFQEELIVELANIVYA